MPTLTREPAARNALEPHDADRLIKLLGMCGSSHAGERASAALKADTLVRSLGLTWRDVIMIAAPALQPEAPIDWREMAAFCHARRWQLAEREREFVEAMAQWRGAPSEKQLAWLDAIHARLCDAAQDAGA